MSWKGDLETKMNRVEKTFDKMFQMLKSKDEEMRNLAVTILTSSCKDLDETEKIILYLHSDRKELYDRAKYLMLAQKKDLRRLEEVKQYFSLETPLSGFAVFLDVVEKYKSTKKINNDLVDKIVDPEEMIKTVEKLTPRGYILRDTISYTNYTTARKIKENLNTIINNNKSKNKKNGK